MEEEQRAFPIVITGHVDHGKSTLIGRLLYDYGVLQKERYDEMKQSSADVGRQDEFAFVLDAFEEERQRGITIDTSQIYFRTSARSYVIIDAPGHREFLRNMITGASYAEAAVLIVDACEGIREQTRRHAWLLTIVGVRDICVVINKLDAYGYDETRYKALCADIDGLFASLSLKPYAVVPLSALKGENVACRSSLMPWYTGPSLVEAIDGLALRPFEERSFRFPIQDIYHSGDERIIVGRIESGSVSVGSEVRVLPIDNPVTVTGIRKYPHTGIDRAYYGEAIGLVIDRDLPVVRGDVLASDELPHVGTRFSAHLFWFHNEYESNEPVILRCATQEVPVRISLEEVFDPGDETMDRTPDRIVMGELALCSIHAERPLVTDSFIFIPELARFVIERDGIPVGGGIVI